VAQHDCYQCDISHNTSRLCYVHEVGYPRGPFRARPGRQLNFLAMHFSRHFDRIAIALSAVCLVHCLAVPVLVAVLPIAAITFGENQHFHGLMLWLVVPTSVAGFTMGYRLHRRAPIVGTGAVGVVILAAAAIYGHSVWAEGLEVAVSVVGSLILGSAHWLNFRAVRRCHLHG